MKRSNRCIRVAISVLMATILSLSISAADKSSVTKPDFAFPKKVSKESITQLNRSLKTGDDIKALRSLMDYAIAQSSIGQDYIPQVISRIDSVMPLLKDESSRSILYLLKAKIYTDIYTSQKYKYDDRKLPLLPLPGNYTEWSGEQFRYVISGLCDKSLEYPESLKTVRLADLKTIIAVEDDALVYYPTLYDFVVYKNIDIRDNLSDFSNLFSILLLSPKETFIFQPYYVPTSKEAEKILSLYSDLLKFHTSDIAPLIMADISRLKFVWNGVYDNMEDDADKTFYHRLMDLYKKYSSSEYSGTILTDISCYYLDQASKKEYYNALKDFCHRYPNFRQINCLKTSIADIEQKSVDINISGYAVPNTDFNIIVRQTNVNDLTLKIYSVDQSPFETSVDFESSNPKLIKEEKVHFNGEIPFSDYRNVKIQFPKSGSYVVLATVNGIESKKVSYISKIICSDIAMALMKNHDDFQTLVVNSSDGSPVKDAEIILSRYRKGKDLEMLGRTNADGLFDFSFKKSTAQVVAQKDGDVYSQTFNIFGYGSWSYDWTTSARIFTALPIYRPGETVEFNAVVYQWRRLNRRLYRDQKVSVRMRNANGLAIDTLELKTDDYGRINGQFDIPKGELTGNYYIEITTTDDKEGIISSQMFTVSDYKMPTYYVNIESVLQSEPEKGDVTVKGSCRTYSGVGLGGVPMDLKLSVSSRPFWRSSNEIDFYAKTDTTDAKGNFTIVFPSALFDNSPAPDGIYTLNIDATTSSGESRQGFTTFARGNSVDIDASITKNIDITNPVRLNVKAVRSDFVPVDTLIDYEIRSIRDSIIASGSIKSSDPVLDLTKIASGSYSMVLRIQGNLCDSIEIDPVVFYRPTDKMSPVEYNFWMPYASDESMKFNDDRKVKFLYATKNPESYILMTFLDGSRTIKREWIKATPGMHSYELTLPTGLSYPYVTFCNITDFSLFSYNIKLEYKKKPSVKIIAESFRDKVAPGTEETWTFRTVDQDSSAVASAMILDMYNGALDALKVSDWSFSPASQTYNTLRYDLYSNYFSYNLRSKINSFRCQTITQPELQLYGVHSFYFYSSYLARSLYGATAGNAVMMKSAATAAPDMLNADGGTEDIAMEEEASMLYDVVATGYGVQKTLTYSITKNFGTTPSFEYRDAETPLAFYRPMLNTDANGNLSFSYRVPNANTTWRFRALAYTDSLLTDLFSANVTANKPIMVQPNLPRFVRTGDSIEISALIINNSEDDQSVSTQIEIFNPSTQKVILSSDTIETIRNGASSTASIRFVTPDDLPFVGYRIKSTGEQFADGEQSLIPILPASQPVIETVPFYISPDSTGFSLTLPEMGKDANVTLQYCDNPIWLAVTALPGLRTTELSTPADAADAIFSAAVAEGIMKDYPVIETALKQWTSSDRSDSTLVSMLEKNADLKTILLKATPWMVDAMSDTERMQRLALLFDRNEISRVYSTATKHLQKLQRDNGGWAWISQSSEASQWATENALFTLGYLNMLGYLPNNRDLNDMIRKALAWDQTETVKNFRKYPKSSFRTFLTLRDQWPSIKPSAEGQQIIAQEIQKIVRNWKKYSVADKSQSIRLLYNNGYKQLSHTVLSSLREFAEFSPAKGLWWPSLGDNFGGSLVQLGISADALLAIHLVDPQSKDIDAIRQWLILQKEAQNWGAGSMTTQIIAAIITTSPKWLQKASDVNISIGNDDLHVCYNDNIIGDFKRNISSFAPSGKKLIINKSEGTPSWGAVYSQSTMRMDSIKPSSCEAVNIEKKFYKSTGDKWIETSDYKVGDRIKVQLLIHTTRDLQYMALTDERAACFEPVEQLPKPIWSEGLCFYRENRDSSTNIFVTNMPKGTYLLEYEMWVNNSGEFSSGIATIQSQYAPQLSAHSSGTIINVRQ